MDKRTATKTSIPSSEQFKSELKRVSEKGEYLKTLRGTVYILMTVAAVAVLIATLMLPVLQVTGTSMEPTLETGQIVIASKASKYSKGDIIAFYFNNKVLLKRVIGLAGDRIVINMDGDVAVNGEEIKEPYLAEKSLGECDLDFPYQVPDGKIFVMGDHRATSVDSRSKAVGCIADEYMVGKVVFRIWPLESFGVIN